MPSFPTVPALPGGNQYGGAPINPFGNMPVAPKLATPPPPPAPMMSPLLRNPGALILTEPRNYAALGAQNPTLISPAQRIAQPPVASIAPRMPAGPIAPAVSRPTPALVDPLAGARNATVSYPAAPPVVSTPPPPPAPAQPSLALRPVPPPAAPPPAVAAPPPPMLTPSSSIFPTLAYDQRVLSDIRNKSDIQAEPVWAQGIDRSARKNPMVDHVMSVADFKASKPPPVAPQASFEGGPNPMMGMGAYQQEPQASEQQTVPLDWNRFRESDEHAKKDIRSVRMEDAPTQYTDAWKGVSLRDAMEPPQTQPASFSFSAPPMRVVAPPQTDLRPAQGYSYEYKDPKAPGAAPGKHFGPMAQDLEQTPAGASVVATDPKTGMKSVDTDRLSLVNASAISEQQKRIDDLEAMLDYGNARQTADTGPRFR